MAGNFAAGPVDDRFGHAGIVPVRAEDSKCGLAQPSAAQADLVVGFCPIGQDQLLARADRIRVALGALQAEP